MASPVLTDKDFEQEIEGYSGNIDLKNRPVISNPDKSFSTEKSFSFSDESGKEILIPSIVNGKELSKQDAIKHYKNTGENLGIFNSIEEANAMAEKIHGRFNASQETLTDSDFLTDADFEQPTKQQGLLQTPPTQKGLADPTAQFLAGLGILGVGTGAKKIVDWAQQPQLRTEKIGIQRKLGDIQGELGTTGTEFGIVPKTLTTDIADLVQQRQTDVSNIKRNTDFTINSLKKQVGILDDTIRAINVSDLADTVKSQYSSFLKSGTEAYGTGLDAMDNYFNKYSKTFDNTDLAQVLDNTLGKLRKTGVNEILDPHAASVARVRDSLVPVKGAEQIYEIRPMSFSEAKGTISALISENPYSGVASRLREQWGKLLEDKAPEEVRGYLGKLNKEYKPFAQARETLSKLIDTSTGEFDNKKLNRYLYNYTKDAADREIVELMKMLGEGSDLVTPMKGIKQKFGVLQAQKEQLRGLKQQIPEVAMTSKERLYNLEKNVEEKIGKIRATRTKSEQLLSRLNVVEEKLSQRSFAGILAKVFKIGKKASGMLSVLPYITDALRYSQDPEAYEKSLETGGEYWEIRKNLAPKGSLERKIQLGQII